MGDPSSTSRRSGTDQLTRVTTLVIDSGTTNSRVWIVENNAIIGKNKIQVGTKDVARTGSVDRLKCELKRAVNEVLRKEKLELEGIGLAAACGMITSDLGLVEVPHLVAPVNLEQLVANAKLVKISDFLPLPILFIPGVKNNVEKLNMNNLQQSDAMRGEETLVFGLLDRLDISAPAMIIILSSHTKAIGINRSNEITCSVTTLSGQIFSAITKHTLLAGSLPRRREEINKKAVMAGYEKAKQFGFLRSLMMVRWMDIFLNTSPADRLYFLEGVIAGSDFYTLRESAEFLPLNFSEQIICVGNRARCEIYKYLLTLCPEVKKEVLIEDEQIAEEATVRGATKIVRMKYQVAHK